MGLLTAVPFRKAVDSSCCTHTQAGGYVQDRWHDAAALHEQRHDSPQRGVHGVRFSLCTVGGVALPASSFITTLLSQPLWCSVVKCLEHLVLNVHSTPIYRLLPPLMSHDHRFGRWIETLSCMLNHRTPWLHHGCKLAYAGKTVYACLIAASLQGICPA